MGSLHCPIVSTYAKLRFFVVIVGRWSWKPISVNECVIPHLPNFEVQTIRRIMYVLYISPDYYYFYIMCLGVPVELLKLPVRIREGLLKRADLGRSRDCSRRLLCQRSWEMVSYKLLKCMAEPGAIHPRKGILRTHIMTRIVDGGMVSGMTSAFRRLV